MLKLNEIEHYLKTLSKQINENNNIKASALIIYKEFLDKNNNTLIIKSIQKTGFFRPSKYNFDIESVSLFFQETITHPNFQIFKNYLTNIENLFLISKKVKNNFNRIKSFIQSEKNLIKYFFAQSDNFFYDYEKHKEPEFILECISLLIIESKKNQYTNGLNISSINHISNNDYNSLIKLSKNIVRFKKIEINIDFFQYKLEKTGNKTYKLSNDKFEKNISMSYIRYDQQRSAIHYETLKTNQYEETFEKNITKILDESDINLFAEIRKNPYSRICPKLIIHPTFINLFTTNNLYLEEKSFLNFFFIDNLLTSHDKNKVIYKNFTILDIIKLQRIFNFISIVYRKYFKKNIKVFKKESILLSSIIPIASKEFLNELLRLTLNTQNKNFIELIQNVISIDFYSLNDFFDIQYNPILSLGNEFIISPTILAKSNLIRSILVKTNNNLTVTSIGDKMIQNLEEKFKKLGFSISTEVKIGAYEIDIIAKKGNEVFIFECKNAYHPVNEFELRNSFAHIQKASHQLDNLKNMISNPSTRKNLANKIGFSLYKTNFNFAIILSNRIFNGYNYNNYRCINSYILDNLLNEGLVTVNLNRYSLWQNSHFHEDDLVDFINGKFISDYENLAHENFVNLDFQDITVSAQRFGFLLEEIADHIDKTYRKI